MSNEDQAIQDTDTGQYAQDVADMGPELAALVRSLSKRAILQDTAERDATWAFAERLWGAADGERKRDALARSHSANGTVKLLGDIPAILMRCPARAQHIARERLRRVFEGSAGDPAAKAPEAKVPADIKSATDQGQIEPSSAHLASIGRVAQVAELATSLEFCLQLLRPIERQYFREKLNGAFDRPGGKS